MDFATLAFTLVIGMLIWALVLNWLLAAATNQKKHLENEEEQIRLLNEIAELLRNKP